MSMKKMIYDRLTGRETSLAVIGLGYVGVPVALRFARCFDVVGYDMDARRIEKLREKYGAGCGSIRFTSLEEELSRAAFYIVTVLTPVNERKNPDLTCLVEATRTVARYLKRGDYVVYESTVYPGCTEEVCVPLLEKGSGLKLGADFKVGYSPERINPNDSEHTFSNTAKIVSANDGQALDEVARVYAEVVSADLCRASGIRVAEAAKMAENVQRSVNIALMNELQRLFSRMGIDMGEVIDMASSKWNFVKYRPGLVGGHCIPVDPLYLVSAASKLGVEMPVTSSGCAVNDGMAAYVVRSLLAAMENDRRGARALLMGITYKENIDDIRNSRIAEMVGLLEREGMSVDVTDPHADPDKVYAMYGIRPVPALRPPYDLIVVAVAHDDYRGLDDAYFRSISRGAALLGDIRGLYKGRIKSLGYWSL